MKVLLLLPLLLLGCGSAPAASTSDEPLDVLVVATRPTWAYRYFRNAWGRAEGIELASHLATAVGAQQVLCDVPTLPETVDGWRRHDVVVLCEWDASEASPACIASLRAFVAGGGGLVTIHDGAEVASYTDPRWRELLPVSLREAASGAPRRKTQLAVVDGAERHPALAFTGEQPASEVVPTLPAVYVQPLAAGLAADARPLLVAKNGGEAPTDTGLTGIILAIRPVGEGRSLWLGSGELWRWRDPHAGRFSDAAAVSMVRAVASR